MSTLTAGVQGDPLRLFFLRLFFLITAGLQGGPLRLFFLTAFYNHILVGGTYILSIDLSIYLDFTKQQSSCTCQQTLLGLPQTRVVLRNHEETCKPICIDIYIRRADRRVTPR